MTIQHQFCFEAAVKSLARVLARIKPTPWEKVFEMNRLQGQSVSRKINETAQKLRDSSKNYETLKFFI